MFLHTSIVHLLPAEKLPREIFKNSSWVRCDAYVDLQSFFLKGVAEIFQKKYHTFDSVQTNQDFISM